MRRLIFFALALALGIMINQSVWAKSKLDTTCPRYPVTAEFQKAITANNGLIEPVHIPGGIAVLITAPTSKEAHSIHAAADKYSAAIKKVNESKGLSPSNADSTCRVIHQGVKSGEIEEHVQNTETGSFITLTSKQPKLIDRLQADGCCQWCVCNGGTWHHCGHCC